MGGRGSRDTRKDPLYRTARIQVHRRVPPEAILELLQERGVGEDDAHRLVAEAVVDVAGARRRVARTNLAVGAVAALASGFLLVLGLLNLRFSLWAALGLAWGLGQFSVGFRTWTYWSNVLRRPLPARPAVRGRRR